MSLITKRLLAKRDSRCKLIVFNFAEKLIKFPNDNMEGKEPDSVLKDVGGDDDDGLNITS